MAVPIQLPLFEELPPSNYDLERELDKTKEQVNKVRRGLFRRYDELSKEVEDLRKEYKDLLKVIKSED